MSRHDVFDALVVAHALVAVVAFGFLALSGIYGRTAQRGAGGADAGEEVRRYFAKPPRIAAAVIAVGLLGVAAIAVQPHGGGLGQAWTEAGLFLWVAASVLWARVVRPAEVALHTALATPDGGLDGPAARELDRRGGQLAWSAVATSTLFVVAVGLMIWQP